MKEKTYYSDIDRRLKKIQEALKQDKKDISEFEHYYEKIIEKKGSEENNDNIR